MSSVITKNLNVSLITENDFCISCGSCTPACPFENIQYGFSDQKGIFEPSVINESPCVSCTGSPCLEVCPSFKTDFTTMAEWNDPNTKIGPHVGIYTGFSNNQETRYKASSGGLIREISKYLLDNKIITGVVTTIRVEGEGISYEPSLITNSTDIDNLPGSIYHNTSFDKAYELIKSAKGKVLVTGIPCQLTGLKKLLTEKDPESNKNVYGYLGLMCGWMFSYHSVWAYSKYVGIDHTKLVDISYRGEGKTGDLLLKTSETEYRFKRKTGMKAGSEWINYRTVFDRNHNLKRCHYCVEHLNYNADIVVGDAWLPKFSSDGIGTSIIIARNLKFQKILMAMKKTGKLTLEKSSEEEVIQSQGEDLALGLSAKKLNTYTKNKGEFAPSFKTQYVAEIGRLNRWEIFRKYIYPNVIRKLISHRRYREIRYLKLIELLPQVVKRVLNRINFIFPSSG